MAEPELWMTTDGGQCDGELTLHHEVEPLRVRLVPFDEMVERMALFDFRRSYGTANHVGHKEWPGFLTDADRRVRAALGEGAE